MDNVDKNGVYTRVVPRQLSYMYFDMLPTHWVKVDCWVRSAESMKVSDEHRAKPMLDIP